MHELALCDALLKMVRDLGQERTFEHLSLIHI